MIRQLAGRSQVVSHFLQCGELIEVLGSTKEPFRHDEVLEAAHAHLHPADAHRHRVGAEGGVPGFEAARLQDDVDVADVRYQADGHAVGLEVAPVRGDRRRS